MAPSRIYRLFFLSSMITENRTTIAKARSFTFPNDTLTTYFPNEQFAREKKPRYDRLFNHRSSKPSHSLTIPQTTYLPYEKIERRNYLLFLLVFSTDATKRTNFNSQTRNDIYRYNYDISNATGSIESYATYVGSFDAYLSKRIRVHRRIRAVARTNTYPGLWSRFSRVIVRVRMRAKKRRGWKVVTRRFDACLENS